MSDNPNITPEALEVKGPNGEAVKVNSQEDLDGSAEAASPASPRPWRIFRATEDVWCIVDADNNTVQHMADHHEGADTALIVQAANSFEALKGALTTLVSDMETLIRESKGVAGLHLNGDVAPWDDLTEGGRYESWLKSLDAAQSVLAALQSPTLGGNA